ncbi:hypothetical protein Ahy_B10g102453 [Arachis hypogaea]|uniref:Uncharacterized protein n=3 Tax=Arachis hypogaea TaxID=3818 RepID=A0A444X1X7_ARAHY|nr:hypothetical protein Ahy_B10g102453 [Arachis hypogaea]
MVSEMLLQVKLQRCPLLLVALLMMKRCHLILASYMVYEVECSDHLKQKLAENMIAHKEEIFLCPKRTWFIAETEKKASINNDKSFGKVISAQEAEDLKMKEKGKREREKNLSRKKRRKLEAAREMLEDEGDDDKLEVKGANKKEKGGLSLVDVTYRRAKAVKAVKKAMDSELHPTQVCIYCKAKLWNMRQARMIPQSASSWLGSYEDGVEYYVCLNGHMLGTCTLLPLSDSEEVSSSEEE